MENSSLVSCPTAQRKEEEEELKRRGSRVSTPRTFQSAGQKISQGAPILQKLQEMIRNEPKRKYDPLQSRRDNESRRRHRGRPLAKQLQELISEGLNTSAYPLQRHRDNESHHRNSALPLVQKFQQLIEADSNTNVGPVQGFGHNESSHSYRGVPLVKQFQELVQETRPPLLGHPPTMVKKVNKKIISCPRKAADSVKKSRPNIQEDIVESDNDAQVLLELGTRNARSDFTECLKEVICDHVNPLYKRMPGHVFQHNSDILEDISDALDTEKKNDDEKTNWSELGTTGFPVNSAPTIWERFQNVLQSAPPETNATFNNSHNPSSALSGFAARLQKVLQISKSKHVQFQKTLRLGQAKNVTHSGGHSQCLDVLIVRKISEAYLVTCQCEVLKWPEAWNVCSKATIAGEECRSMINVLFSTRISPEQELKVGQVVRVHPPWQEVRRAGKSRKTILCTYVSEMVS